MTFLKASQIFSSLIIFRREAEKAEHCVALLYQPGMFERTVARGELHLSVVFCNHQRIGSKQLSAAGAAQKAQRACVFRLCLIGRIEEDEVDLLREFAWLLQESADSARLNRIAAADLQGREVGAERGECWIGVLGKPHMGRTTAEGLDSDGSCSGVKIDKAAAFESRRKDVEQCLPQPVAGWPGVQTTRSGKLAGAVDSCNNAHLPMV